MNIELHDTGQNWRRVLYDGDPKEQDYIDAAEEIEEICSQLSDIRHRLHMLHVRVDIGHIHSDGITGAVEGALSCAITTLYTLVNKNEARSFRHRAEISKELWEDVAEHPENYIIKEGVSESWAHQRRYHEERKGG